jgi:hypothetical protein
MKTLEKHEITNAAAEEGEKNFILKKAFRKRFVAEFGLEEENFEKLKIMKEEYIAKYPQETEAIEALFGLAKYLKNQKIIRENRVYRKDIKAVFQDQTEYMFLLSHLTCQYSDQYYLKNLWSLMQDAGEKVGDNVSRLRKGVVAQVATFKIFERLGYRPELSHPRQDAYDKIDMWVGGNEPVQIKSWPGAQPVVLEAETIAFPAARITMKDLKERVQDCYISSDLLGEINGFRAKVKKYGEMMQKDTRGYFIMIPPSKINSITGEPTPDLVEAVRDKFASAEQFHQ